MVMKGGKRFAEHAHHGEIPLTPAGRDRFTSREWFLPNVTFVRDSSGRVNGINLGGGRVTAIRFIRR